MTAFRQYYRGLFENDEYVVVSNFFNLISIFDDTFYSRNDYDLLNPGQRNYLIQKLTAQKHSQISGKQIQHNDLGHQLRFLPSSQLGTNSLDRLKESYSQVAMFITTPGQHFLFLVEKLSIEQNQDYLTEIRRLIRHQPVNLPQLKDVSVSESYYPTLQKIYTDLNNYQNEMISQFHKHKKPLS